MSLFVCLKTRVKALFDYNPREDPLIPCQDAGLQFKKGDILHIVSQDDPLWWQAKKEGDATSSAGLIPARLLQERSCIFHISSVDVFQITTYPKGQTYLKPPCYFTGSLCI